MTKVPKVILLIESSRASGRSLLRGVADYARHCGPWAFYWEPGGLEKVWPKLKTLDADGIILRDVEKVEEVLFHNIPAIVFGHSKEEIPGLVNVCTDDEIVGRMAAEHLLNSGFRQFAYCGFKDKPWALHRHEAFLKRLGETNQKAEAYWASTKAAEKDWRQEQRALARWLKSLPKPVGLMACNDDFGRNVIEASKLAGLQVPEEVAVIGADDDELVCELSDPPMSSVGINFERAGYECAHLLDRLMRGKPVNEMRVVARSTHVAARQSTDIMTVQDPHLAQAIRFIHDHGREPLQVGDAVKAAGLSRRVLEKRFRRTLGRSVLSEIRRVRVDLICRMLAETNQPISEIAAGLGYDGIDHVARYFRREKQMSPLAYRKCYGRK